jgi:phosphoserine phosphatase RsbU/P
MKLGRPLRYTHLHRQKSPFHMSTTPPQSGTGFRGWYKRQSRIGRLSFILTCIILAMLFIARTSHAVEVVFAVPVILLCGLVLSPLLIILLYRWTTRRLLWKVRNRLIVTYALLSLAPVVLCITLAAIAAYIFGGQYATNSALTLLDHAANEVRDETASLALLGLNDDVHAADRLPSTLPSNAIPVSLAVVKSGAFHPLIAPSADDVPNPFIGQPVPSWLRSGFTGLVLFQGKLYLVSFTKVPEPGHTVEVLGMQPFNLDSLNNIASDLGRVLLLPGFNVKVNSSVVDVSTDDDNATNNAGTSKTDNAEDENFARIDAGSLPPRAHLIDPPVVFSSPTSVIAWTTDDDIRAIVTVFSRPSILYTRLFASTNGLGDAVRAILIGVAIFFGLLELFALLMAAGLSHTITRSVAELYLGTREVDRGNLEHRIVIKRQDQLGALGNSFNRMTASIVDLLAQQREKERLLSELSIAQEVQTSLYPQSPVTLPGFEIHAVCLPARSVSGDYFDFIFGRHGNELCLALGDISGKGISAALLMASLHSAVRAFGISNSGAAIAAGPSRPSPAVLLELLNKHIYANTPVEKYATLFLAYYDGATRKLTYTNAGHPAPIILSANGTVQHLDVGGPPVGLFNGLKFQEATIELQPGDLLMAFSDGLTEPEQNDEQFGEERLFDYVREHRTEPLPVLATNTLHTLQQWIGNHEQPDDMTLLLARQL